MIKIETITNAHQWDGVELSEADYIKLEEVLSLSKSTHIIKAKKSDYPEPYLTEQMQNKKEGGL